MGAAQMEINLLHGDPLVLADQAFLIKIFPSMSPEALAKVKAKGFSFNEVSGV